MNPPAQAPARPKSRRVPLDQRKRTECSCDRCKSRKQKCHRIPGQEKCRHCETHNYECTVTKSRKQRLYGSVDHFRSRLLILESLVKGLIPEAGDLSSIENLRRIGSSLGIPLPPDVNLPEEKDKGDSDSSKLKGNGTNAEADDEPDSEVTSDEKELVHDLQGEGQYIGPGSSYFFQMKLRTLLGRDPTGWKGRMYLFGPNPTADDPLSAVRAVTSSSANPSPDAGGDSQSFATSSPSFSISHALLDSPMIDDLIRFYFERVNTDFPVLHEASFLEKYDAWLASPDQVDRTWLCTFFCVLILARRVCPIEIPQDEEERWWRCVQALLPHVLFTSSVAAIKAMVLAGLHLHNTGHRDACWTLTGAAVRISFAIGLHRDEVELNGPRQARELRKSLWWTLYEFEQLQVSSHDRPSAIEDALSSTKPPHERIMGLSTSQGPPEHMVWWAKLSVLMGTACRTLLTNASPVKACAGPLSPVPTLLRDLTRWRDALPQHLSLRVFETQPAAFQRSVLLLHIKYHYVVSTITRSAFLCHLGSLNKKEAGSKNPFQLPSPIASFSSPEIQKAAEACALSGRSACELLVKLDELGKFNATTWWDIYYMYCQTLVLVLSIIYDVAKGVNCTSSLELLQGCAQIARRHLSNPMIPATMHRWAVVVTELDIMAQSFFAQKQAGAGVQEQENTPDEQPIIFPEATSSNNNTKTMQLPSHPHPHSQPPPQIPQFKPTPTIYDQRGSNPLTTFNNTPNLFTQRQQQQQQQPLDRMQGLVPAMEQNLVLHNNDTVMTPYTMDFSLAHTSNEERAWRGNIQWDNIGSLLLGAEEFDFTQF